MKIVYAKEAIQDLEEIEEHLSQHNDAEAVDKRLDKIDIEIKRLEGNPNIGSWLKNRIAKEADWRYTVCGRYVIFYLIKGDIIEITRITDGRQNWTKTLF